MTLPIADLFLLALATYSVTRFLVVDTLTRPIRNSVLTAVWFRDRIEYPGESFAAAMRMNERADRVPDCAEGWRGKLAELIACPVCMGWWVALVTYAMWRWLDHPAAELWIAAHALRAGHLLIRAAVDK